MILARYISVRKRGGHRISRQYAQQVLVVCSLVLLYRPLHCAARRGFETVVRILTANNANLDARNIDGDTALHRYCSAYIARVQQSLQERLSECGADHTVIWR